MRVYRSGEYLGIFAEFERDILHDRGTYAQYRFGVDHAGAAAAQGRNDAGQMYK
jgi:hypothetical protein